MVENESKGENLWKGKYERFIVIEKSDLTALVRLSNSLMKTVMDDYGRSLMFHCDGDSIVIGYANKPYFMRNIVTNHSGSVVSDFFVSIPLLCKVLSSCGEYLVIVEKNDGVKSVYSFEVLGGLIYLETMQSLEESAYGFSIPATDQFIDMKAADFCFHSLSNIVALSERNSEKVIALKNGNAYFNATFFSAKVTSPFTGGEEFILYKSVSDILSVLTDVFSEVRYSVNENMLALSSTNMSCLVPIGLKVDDFYSPVVDSLLNFNADITFNNDQIVNLVNLVNGLDYLCDILSYDFLQSELNVTVYSRTFENKSVYNYPYLSGTASKGTINVSAKILKVMYGCLNSSAKYTLTKDGLCVSMSDMCNLILRPVTR